MLYCYKSCQVDHWTTHKNHCAQTSCEAINAKASKQNTEVEVAPLIGKNFYIQGKITRVVWDSGSQVTIVDEK